MSLSVIINARNEEKFIAGCIESILNQTRKADEIIVVDHKSTDKTTEIASKYPIKIIEAKRSKRGYARDIGWRNATGDIIIYADADDLFSENWIDEIEKKFNEGADAVIDRIKVYKPKNLFEKSMDAVYDLRYKDYKPFSAWAFKREVLEKTGGFKDIWIEEYELGIRLLKQNYKILLADKALRYHRGEPRSFSNNIKRNFIFGKNEAVDIFMTYPEKFPTTRVFLFLLFLLLATVSIFLNLFLYFILISLPTLYILLFLKVAFIQKAWHQINKVVIFGIAFNSLIRTIFWTSGVVYAKIRYGYLKTSID